jgi:GT2 family glycosyltransferase
MPRRLPSRRPRGLLADLPRRAYLTVKHLGWGEFLYRVVTFPLRFVGLERGLTAWVTGRRKLRRVRRWYSSHGRSVTVVIATYGPPQTTLECVERVRRTTDSRRVRIVVVDDASPEEHRAALRRLEGAELFLSPENAGFAASVNRGLALAGESDDVVVMNNDVAAHEHWLERLQDAAYEHEETGIVGPKLLYPDGRIQSAGTYRNLGAPEWFDHRYRFKRDGYGPAEVPAPALAVTGACMYVKRSALARLGGMDERYRMGYEDVDWCLRAWEEGLEVRYAPGPALTHLESTTRGVELGERERESQDRFWAKWGGWFDGRPVRDGDGRLRVIYVTEGTEVGGGHRDVFEHLNRLRERGHAAELYSLGGQPDWFPLRAPVRMFPDYDRLVDALAGEEAIKVATWWKTAPPVWRASVSRGVPVYFVQDIETSYYPTQEEMRDRVLASYREEFRYVTISGWNRERLAELGLEAAHVPPGIDFDNFRPLDRPHRDDVVLAIGRANPLKNLDLTVDAWKRMDPRAELWMFGVEPELGERHGARYIEAPSDTEVNELLNEATVFVQTSRHEGFALPPLEAMAAGTPVVCTDAHGNRDFCRDGENCLVVDANPDAVAAGLRRVLAEPELRRRLADEGRRTAAQYRWDRRIDEVEAFYERVAHETSRATSARSA